MADKRQYESARTSSSNVCPLLIHAYRLQSEVFYPVYRTYKEYRGGFYIKAGDDNRIFS